ncbi:hypothetical protein B0H19DRAFT_1265782 [Mycena capillaripes]|nr:hypothetical protein B0H19DRAFT_1265782 [Mycena capillaripes]
MPGISVPGKLLIAQVSTGLVIFMGGIIGHPEPLFSCADWTTIKAEVDPIMRSITLDLMDCTASGSLFGIDEAGLVKESQPGVQLRIRLEKQASFWALAYLSATLSSTAARPRPLSFSVEEHGHITGMLEYFKNDEGLEYCAGDGGAPGEEPSPPGYTAGGRGVREDTVLGKGFSS